MMKTYTRSIIELFDGKKRFMIPLYQRQYAWNVSPQLELLWDDIERIALRIHDDRMSVVPHFMGAMVISQIKTFGKEVQAFEIIDGQQRLTTFSILLASLRDIAIEGGSKYANELQKYLINEGVMARPEEFFKLWPSQTDRKAFAKIITPESDIESIIPKQYEDGFVKKAILAHEYFKSAIRKYVFLNEAFDEHRFETIFEALKDGLAIVSIELEGGDDPQTIFETLNSRGVELSPSDLMRNFIFQRAKGLGQVGGSLTVDKLYEKHWLPLDHPFWSQEASRGRQTRSRLDWLLTDHLSMSVGNIISIENLYESYRRWILNERPFLTVVQELEAITASAQFEERLFEQDKSDALGDFGRFANAFDVSTAMPLVLYFAAEANLGERIKDALAILKSYILRRDICGLTTKNYNKLFVGLIPKLREATIDQVDFLYENLSERISDIDRWPNDHDWKLAWMQRGQYGTARQSRLNYLFEMIEKAMRNERNEDIEIKSALTIEHIMPQQWQENWAMAIYESIDKEQVDLEYWNMVAQRDHIVNTLGNLTLLTQKLNSSVSNGPYKVKMPAIRAHSSLALNRDLNEWNHWDDDTIFKRGEMLFDIAKKIWLSPMHKSIPSIQVVTEDGGISQPMQRFPEDGTRCEFTYGGAIYKGRIVAGAIALDGISGQFGSFSAASKHITKTSRNGWNDWYLYLPDGQSMLADDWRRIPKN